MVDSGTDTVLVEPDDDIVTLRLNRPDKLNALGPEPIRGLRAALADLVGDERGVLLTGAGDGTCAGMDTAIVGQDDYPESHSGLDDTLRDVYEHLAGRTSPTAVAGRGVLVGAGFALSLRCDFLVLGTETTVALPEIRYDIPVLRNARLLAREASPRVAKEIALTGRQLDPERLAAMGLANDLVPEEEVEATAHDLLATVAEQNRSHVVEVLEAL